MHSVKRGIAAMAFIFLTACHSVPEPPAPAEAYSSMDAFVSALAERVKSKFDPQAKETDFNIIPSQASWPIGTVLRPGTTYPVDTTVCLVNPVEKFDIPNLFPSFTRVTTGALDIGLDNALIKKLVDFGIKVKDKEDINFKVNKPQIQMMDDSTADRLMNNEACRGVLSKRKLWLVRGYIIGQRTFSFARGGEGDSSTHGKIEKVASFTIDFSDSSSVKIIDDDSISFLQIVSEVNLQPSEPRFAKLSIPVGAGKVYVQRDKQDTTDTAERVVEAMYAANIPVIQRIEGIDSSRAPKFAQVRYFNDGDKAASEKVLLELKKEFPDATTTRVPLPAPRGQLEVVLPQAK